MESKRFSRLRTQYIDRMRQCREGKKRGFCVTWGTKKIGFFQRNYRDSFSEKVPPKAPNARGRRLVATAREMA